MHHAEQGYRPLEVSNRYQDALEGMILHQENGVTIFRGGPLDLRHNGIHDAWLTPILVSDGDSHTSFHAIQVNGGQDMMQGADFELNVASDIELKLGDQDSPQVAELNKILTDAADGRPRTILRPSIAGNIAYPVISTPATLAHPDVILARAQKAAGIFGSQLKVDGSDIYHLEQEVFVPTMTTGDLTMGKVRQVNASFGEVFVYPVHVNGGDPWKYYEVIAATPLEDIGRKGPMTIRVDSGCDIGQCYHDGGCDCRAQLHDALIEAQSKDGIIIHIPAQDGRGYGMAPKMATEGGKRGIDVGYNAGKPPMDTIKAATELLGPNYDIRTYESVGAMLMTLGFSRVTLLTDSKRKLDALEKAGLEVIRQPTNTQNNGNHHAHNHIQAKHSTPDYFAD